MKSKSLQNEFYELKELVEEKLFQIFLKEFKRHSIEEEVYCLNICYGSEELIPPLFAFGKSKDKEDWVKNNVEDIDTYLWNIAEYTNWDKEFIVEDDKTKELFQRYNHLASELELWNVQKESILMVSKKLQKYLCQFDWNMSDDFVIAVTDLEQVDVSKNFEFLNDNSCNSCGYNPLEAPLYNDDFSELLQVSYDYLTKQQEIMQEEYGIGNYDRWFYDNKTGYLTFSDDGVDKLKIKYEETGTLSNTSNTWLWSWANESLPSEVKSEIVQVKKFGEDEGYEPLTKAQWEADMSNAWEMTIVAAYLMNAKGAYRVPTEKLYSFMIFKDVIDLRE